MDSRVHAVMSIIDCMRQRYYVNVKVLTNLDIHEYFDLLGFLMAHKNDQLIFGRISIYYYQLN